MSFLCLATSYCLPLGNAQTCQSDTQSGPYWLLELLSTRQPRLHPYLKSLVPLPMLFPLLRM